VRCWTRIIRLVLSVFTGILSVPAKDARPNAAVKLPITDLTDRVFVPIAAEKELAHAWVGQVVQSGQGFLWFSTRDSMVRYDGHEIRRYSPGTTGSNGIFVQECCRYALSRDQSGKIWIGAADSVYRYDPALRQSRPKSFRV
jgi:ligand-binding sensor domain-containing protein